jgi:hypothetical protein
LMWFIMPKKSSLLSLFPVIDPAKYIFIVVYGYVDINNFG